MGNGRWSGRSSGRRLGKSGIGALGRVSGGVHAAGGGFRVARIGFPPLCPEGSGSTPSVSRPASPKALASSLSSSSLKSKPEARAILGQLPLIFEPNQGQADPQVKFLARGAGYSLFLDATGAVLAMQDAPSHHRVDWIGARQTSEQFVRMKLVRRQPCGSHRWSRTLPGKSNYMIGNDPQKWHNGHSAVCRGSLRQRLSRNRSSFLWKPGPSGI